MKYTVHITRQAELDMDAAANYIQVTLMNPEAAYRLIVNAENKMKSLNTFPERNPVIDDPVIALWEVRYLKVDNYLAFYVISEEEEAVYILRFLYGKRNWLSILQEDF